MSRDTFWKIASVSEKNESGEKTHLWKEQHIDAVGSGPCPAFTTPQGHVLSLHLDLVSVGVVTLILGELC